MAQSTTRQELISLIQGSAGGVAYAITATTLSHPFDTIKTRQQVSGALQLSNLYRGFSPALFGSVVFRTVPFIAYNVTTEYARPRNKWLRDRPIALAAMGGLAGGLARSLVECPCEYAKTRLQVSQKWAVDQLYTGLGITMARNAAVISLFWAFVESSKPWCERVAPGRYTRAFVSGGICSAAAWCVVFPLDVIKSRLQSGRFHDSMRSHSILAVARTVGATRGWRGFYAGLSAGLARTVVANGVAFTCYSVVQDWMLEALMKKE